MVEEPNLRQTWPFRQYKVRNAPLYGNSIKSQLLIKVSLQLHCFSTCHKCTTFFLGHNRINKTVLDCYIIDLLSQDLFHTHTYFRMATVEGSNLFCNSFRAAWDIQKLFICKEKVIGCFSLHCSCQPCWLRFLSRVALFSYFP